MYPKRNRFLHATKQLRSLNGFWKTTLMILKLWFYFSAFILHIYLVLQIYFICSSAKFEWWITSYFLIVLLSAITVHFLIFRAKTLRRLWNNLYDHLLLTRDVEVFSRKCKCIVLGSIMYLCIVEACSIITAIKVRPHVLTLEMDVVCPRCDRYNLTTSTSSAIIVVDYSLYALCVLGSLTVYPMFFTLACMMVAKFVDNYSFILKESKARGEPLSLQDVQVFRREFKKVSTLTQSVNGVFKSLVLVWYIFAVVIACQGITYLFTSLDDVENLFSIAYYVPLYFQCLFILLVVTIVASRIPDKVEEAFILVQDLTCSYCGDSKARPLEREVYQELRLLLLQMTNPVTGLTAGGCFLITKTFCVSFLGAATTYSVILIQLNPDIQKKLQN